MIPSPIPIKTPQNPRQILLLCLGLVLLVFAVFGQSIGHDFVNYDDNEFIIANTHLLSGLTWNNVRWALVAGTGGAMTDTDYWRPVSILSQMADVQFFGLHAGSHHAVNVLLQALNSVLLFLILRLLTGAFWRSAFVAALFAIHPLHVESVAWISERKDLLSALFFLLTLGAYVRYARHSFCWGNYLLVLLLSALAMASKPMVITLPFVLILLDSWPLHRLGKISWKRLLLEKIPLVAMALFVAVITLHAPGGRNEGIMDQLPWSWRLGNAVVAYATYLWQMIWPFNLSAFYPHPGKDLSLWSLALSAFVLLVISALVLWQRRRGYLMVGWLWYLGMLLPVIGLVQSGEQAHADRYTYLPLIGIFLMIAWGLNDWVGDHPRKRILLGSALALPLIPLSYLAHLQTSYWHDSVDLWTHSLACYERNSFAHNNLADALDRQNKQEAAIQHYERALALDPRLVDARINIANFQIKRNEPDKALPLLLEALARRKNFPEARYNLACYLAMKGDNAGSIEQLRLALAGRSSYPEANLMLGNLLLQSGNPKEAVPHLQEGLKLYPNDPLIRSNLGSAYSELGEEEGAFRELEKALQLAPTNPTYMNNLAWVLATSTNRSVRNGPRAIQLAKEALKQADAMFADRFLYTLAAAYAASGQVTTAINTAKEAQRLAREQGNKPLEASLGDMIHTYQESEPKNLHLRTP